MNRIIMHVDMNAFFASVEQQINPALRGKPIAVIGSQERTVVTTSSYEARAYGVKTGMTKYEAKRLCPHIILVTGNNGRYTDTCRRLVEIFLDYTPMLKNRFGVIGERLKLMAQGIDDSPVIPPGQEPDAKSVGHSMTLDRDVSDRETLEQHILQLSEMVGRRLRRGGYTGRTVALTLRYSDFTAFTKRTTTGLHTNNSIDIYIVVIDILNSIRLQQPVRMLGVSVSNLIKNMSQIPLLRSDRNKKASTRAMDEINDRYGDFCITWGTLIERYHHTGVISPAWRPSGVKCVNFSAHKTKNNLKDKDNIM